MPYRTGAAGADPASPRQAALIELRCLRQNRPSGWRALLFSKRTHNMLKCKLREMDTCQEQVPNDTVQRRLEATFPGPFALSQRALERSEVHAEVGRDFSCGPACSSVLHQVIEICAVSRQTFHAWQTLINQIHNKQVTQTACSITAPSCLMFKRLLYQAALEPHTAIRVFMLNISYFFESG